MIAKNRFYLYAAWLALIVGLGAPVAISLAQGPEMVLPAEPASTWLHEPLLPTPNFAYPALDQPSTNQPLVSQPPSGQPSAEEPILDDAFQLDGPEPPYQSLKGDLPAAANDVNVKIASALGGLHDFWGYRYGSSSMDWIIGSARQFGMFSFGGDHYQTAGFHSGLGLGTRFHFLNGPIQTDMPSRVYDFSVAYQCRRQLGPLAYDVAVSVLAASDFEGSSREGIRFPSHAVGYLQFNPAAQLVFGVDYLDRGDVKLLPVGGLIWLPRPDMRFELVFPRPRAVFQLSPPVSSLCGEDSPLSRQDEYRLYVAGDLGGGSWAIERTTLQNDLATYRDLRLSVGIESVHANGSCSAFEICYLFARRLEYTSASGNTDLDDTAMIRFVHFY